MDGQDERDFTLTLALSRRERDLLVGVGFNEGTDGGIVEVFECLIGVCADKQDLCRHVRLGGEAYRGVGCVEVIFDGGELRHKVVTTVGAVVEDVHAAEHGIRWQRGSDVLVGLHAFGSNDLDISYFNPRLRLAAPVSKMSRLPAPPNSASKGRPGRIRPRISRRATVLAAVSRQSRAVSCDAHVAFCGLRGAGWGLVFLN